MSNRQGKHGEQSVQNVPGLNEAECWEAVAQRDPAFDGLFWYGVRTTGVYCRPSCPSRRPKREHVAFFALPDAARRAGLRACRRCCPDDVVFRDPQAEVVRNVCRLIDENLEESPDLAYLSSQVKVSRYHLQRLFKKLMGISPRRYAEARREALFKAVVREGRSVTEALYDAGYGSSSRLYENAAAHLGMTPAAYGKGGRGMSIVYTTVASKLGWLLVAATDRGICSVMLGDSEEKLTTELHGEFPRAEIGRDDRQLRSQVKTLLDCLAGQQPHADLPLDVQGTAFQMRIWEELRRIPRGRTVSYSELAARIGKPTAARAVARACATNPVAILTPCHRVIRETGELSGYRWGIERKRKLLEEERKDHPE